MGQFYTFLIYVYQLLLKLVSLWHPKAKSLISGRREAWSILQNLPKSDQKRYWFHCASLGEYDMALPLIEACRLAQPEVEIVVSFYSPSGMQHYQKRGFEPNCVFYLPADTPSQMKHLLKVVQADRLYLLKYEFWPNLLLRAHKAGLEVFAVSTILRPTQIYFKWYGVFFKNTLQYVSYFGVQNQNTQQLLLTIGVKPERIELLGDLRFNRVIEAKAKVQRNAILEQFAAGYHLLILGSSWPQEEKILHDVICGNTEFLTKNRIKVLIAPHDVGSSHIFKLRALFRGAKCFSDPEQNFHTTDILILDTIGHLSAAYQYGAIAFVGGGFSGNLHNILEPLAFGLPVVFGPKHQKFPEAQQFLDLGFASAIENEKDFVQLLKGTIVISENRKKAIEKEVFNLQVKMSAKIVG
jgi:3-deoxy-D-manno-octulosonic-acid transferase